MAQTPSDPDDIIELVKQLSAGLAKIPTNTNKIQITGGGALGMVMLYVAMFALGICCAALFFTTREMDEQRMRIDLLEVYKTRHEGRINALENPPKQEP